jgi:GDPmannose 4,6-dehydratase
LRLGNLDAKRDWGFAGDYVRAMWLMLQQDTPDDYVISTDETHSVRELCELAFARAGLDYEAREGGPEVLPAGRGAPAAWRLHQGAQALGWVPECSFQQLVHMMVDADVERVKSEMSHR